MVSAVALRGLKRLSLMIGTVVVTLVFASPASAGPGIAGADIVALDNGTVKFWGQAFELYPSWTYSFRLRQGPQGSWPLEREWAWGGQNGMTGFTTPTYHFQRWGYGTNCVEFRIYHSPTVGNNLVDVSEECA